MWACEPRVVAEPRTPEEAAPPGKSSICLIPNADAGVPASFAETTLTLSLAAVVVANAVWHRTPIDACSMRRGWRKRHVRYHRLGAGAVRRGPNPWLREQCERVAQPVASSAQLQFEPCATDMTLEAPILIAVSIACDVFGQTFFKLGAMRLGVRTRHIAPPSSLWMGLGLVVYAVEIFVWLRVLAIAPLTVAAPLASLNYIGVMLVGRWLFSERIARRQWAGAGLVTLGAVAVALTGG